MGTVLDCVRPPLSCPIDTCPPSPSPLARSLSTDSWCLVQVGYSRSANKDAPVTHNPPPDLADTYARASVDIIAAYRIDRAGWAPGPWDGEGDAAAWITDVGLPGAMFRNRMGDWTGYVAIDNGHPYHGKSYDEIDDDVVAHGGLTFAGEGTYRLPELPGVWWLGFDCAHAWDVVPAWTADAILSECMDQIGGTYRDAVYVRAEVERLAAQLAELPPAP